LYGDKPFGTVTFFCGGTRVATTVLGPGGRIAVGTQVSDVVRRKVLEEGGIWLDRAYVVDEWYLSAYEPIRGPSGEPIGILYVGVLEQKYVDIRNRTILILSLVTVPALALLLSGAFLTARGIVHPLTDLAAAAGTVAAGNLGVELGGTTDGAGQEIETLRTAFQKMIAALRGREEALRSQNLELEQANRDYQELLSFVTHELNNSIGSLLLNTSLLAEDGEGLSGEQRDIVDQLLRDVMRFRDMVRNYLNLSRLERGSLGFRPTTIDLRRRVIEPVVKRLARWIDHDRVRIEWDWPEDVLVSGDPDLLDICYSNLIVNALKYGRDWIRISARRSEAGWVLGVHNGGDPIPSDKVELLFRKFARLVGSDDGAGLGLFLVRNIMETHGGRVWCESTPGQGTVFYLELGNQDPNTNRCEAG
jgi:two-component system NtrC family sensor kinase